MDTRIIRDFEEWKQVYEESPFVEVRNGLLHSGIAFFDIDYRWYLNGTKGAEALRFYLEAAKVPRGGLSDSGNTRKGRARPNHETAYWLLCNNAFNLTGKWPGEESHLPHALFLAHDADALIALIDFFRFDPERIYIDNLSPLRPDVPAEHARKFLLMLSEFMLTNKVSRYNIPGRLKSDSLEKTFEPHWQAAVDILVGLGEAGVLLNIFDDLNSAQIDLIGQRLKTLVLGKELFLLDNEKGGDEFRKPQSIEEATLKSGIARVLTVFQVMQKTRTLNEKTTRILHAQQELERKKKELLGR